MFTAEIIVNLVFGLIIYGLATFVLLRMADRLNDPYKRMIRKLFLISLFLMISGWLLSFFNYSFSIFLSNSGKLIAGCGVVIVVWEEFKKGYKEVFGL